MTLYTLKLRNTYIPLDMNTTFCAVQILKYTESHVRTGHETTNIGHTKQTSAYEPPMCHETLNTHDACILVSQAYDS